MEAIDVSGMRYGYYETYCIDCQRDRDRVEYPYRGHPDLAEIRDARVQQERSLFTTAKELDVSPAMISAMELGRYSPTDPRVLAYRTLILGDDDDHRATG